MNATESPYQFITSLNAIRFFAAVGIVIFHFGRWSDPFTHVWIHPYVMFSNLGVTLFFVLSGFIMVHVYGERLRGEQGGITRKQFFTARIARIVPVYLVALCGVFLYVLYDQQSWTLPSLMLQITFLHAWFPHEALSLNFPGWSLSTEMFFYLLFPSLFLFLTARTWPKRWVYTVGLWVVSNAVTIGYVLYYVHTPELADEWVKFFPLLHLNSFVVGVVSGLWYQERQKQISLRVSALAVFAICVIPIIFQDEMYNVFQHNGLLAPVFAVIILAVAQAKGVIQRVLSWRPFVVGGDISYGIYILQAPVYYWVYLIYEKTGLSEPLGEAGRFFTYLCCLFVVCYISRCTIEVWGRRVISRILLRVH